MTRNLYTFIEQGPRATRFVLAFCLVVSAFASVSFAQRQRTTPSLSSEDLLDARSVYAPATPARLTSAIGPASTFYKDPSGAFSLNFPDSGWRTGQRSLDRLRPFDRHNFRKLDSEGRAYATASVYVLSSTTGRPVIEAARQGSVAQSALAASLARQYLSSNASVISVNAVELGALSSFQVVADQTVSNRVVVRALISAFEHRGRVFIVICRAPVEAFDSEAREFSSIAQSLASSVAHSS